MRASSPASWPSPPHSGAPPDSRAQMCRNHPKDFRTSTRVSFPSDDDKVRANGKASYGQANSLGAICPSGPVPQAEVDRHMGNPPALGASGGGVEGSEKLVNDTSPKSVISAVVPRQGPSCSSWTAARPVVHQTAGRGLACPLRRPPSPEAPRRPAVRAACFFELKKKAGQPKERVSNG